VRVNPWLTAPRSHRAPPCASIALEKNPAAAARYPTAPMPWSRRVPTAIRSCTRSTASLPTCSQRERRWCAPPPAASPSPWHRAQLHYGQRVGCVGDGRENQRHQARCADIISAFAHRRPVLSAAASPRHRRRARTRASDFADFIGSLIWSEPETWTSRPGDRPRGRPSKSGQGDWPGCRARHLSIKRWAMTARGKFANFLVCSL
jgi:hypothetical protein